jgi:diguanylate cyclase (GGDEF)-like protein
MVPQSSFDSDGGDVLALLQDFTSIAAARIGNHGTLLEANPAFQVLIGGPPGGRSIAGHFLRPTFDQLLAAPGGSEQCIHNGLVTIGRDTPQAKPMRGTVYRIEGGMLVLVELAEMSQLSQAMSALRAELAGKDETISRINHELQRQKRAMEAMMVVDPLTGLPNRRKLDETLDIEVERARRYRTPLSVVMSDLDQLDQVNHAYGRDAGDTALKRFGQVMIRGTRRSDLSARYTGGTFLAVLPHSKTPGALIAAERLRTQMSITPVPPVNHPLTASFGVTEFRDSDSMTGLLARAEAALRQAKNAGRNRVLASA